MGLMTTLGIGAAGYWLYRSGRLDPYLQRVKDSPYFAQIKEKAGMGSGSASATLPQDSPGSTTFTRPSASTSYPD